MEAEWRIVVTYILLIVFIRSCHCQSTTPGTTTVVVFRGEEASLHCPQTSADFAMLWYTYSNRTSTLIANRFTDSLSLHVNSPWNERNWTIQSASWDLFIPNVLLSDEGTYQCSLIVGVIHHAVNLQVHMVVFRGEAASLQCTQYSADKGIRWSKYSNGVSTHIASLIEAAPDIYNRIVNSPWKERQWTIQHASGDLNIPNVLLSDEGTYQCHPISGTILSAIKLQVHVRPTSFSIEPASLIPVNSNISISATCTADEVRPEPELYWELCGEHIWSTNSSFLVNSTYNVYGYSSAVVHTVVGEDHGCLLTCKLMMQSATEERSLLVQVSGWEPNDSFSAGPVIGGVVGLVVIIIIVAFVVIFQRKNIHRKPDRSVKTANDDGVQYVNSPSVTNRPKPASEPEHTYTRPLPPPVPSDQVEIPIYNNITTASLHHNRSEHYDDVISDSQSKDTPVSNANPDDHTYTSLDPSTRTRPH